MRLLVASIAVAVLIASTASAQDAGTAAQATGNHAVEMLTDGTFKITPSANWPDIAGATTADAKGIQMHPFDNKEWFAVKDAAGVLQAIYGVAPGATLPGEVLASMGDGATIVKTAPPTLIGSIMPSANDIRSALEGMLANARDAVCSMGKNRPSTFGSNVSVQAGLGISGTIEFTAEWETELLCS